MYGMIFSIKSLLARLSPVSAKESFISYKTSAYKLHFLETATGLKFVLTTDTTVGSLQDTLWHIYSSIYVDNVVRNPHCTPGAWISSELFATELDSYVAELPFR